MSLGLLKPDYSLTSKVLNSNTALAKVAKYSGIPIALLALAETIKAIVVIPLKMLGNIFGLYKYPLFKASRIASIDEKSSYVQKIASWKNPLYIAGAILGLAVLTYGASKLYPNISSRFFKAAFETDVKNTVYKQQSDTNNDSVSSNIFQRGFTHIKDLVSRVWDIPGSFISK